MLNRVPFDRVGFPLRISTQRFKEDLKLPVPMLHGVAKTKMSKGQPVTMLHGVATTKNAKGKPVQHVPK
jgi:hypothetical protein